MRLGEKKIKNEKNMTEVWENFKWYNIYVAGVPEGATGTGKIFEDTMAMNFLNLVKTVNPKIQEVQQTSSSINLKKTTPRHIIIKILKSGDKENIPRAARGEKRHVACRG